MYANKATVHVQAAGLVGERFAVATNGKPEHFVRVTCQFDLPISPVELGLRLREVREAAGLTQEELAQRVGVTDGAISFMEMNTGGRGRYADLARLIRICDVCNFQLDLLFRAEWNGAHATDR
jgi:DNA-binding XRE family transcriptional regulator